ncbi:hypothetical protein [Kalamiella sp. sgz302252]|uniref:hypothetical protein n=1 Tax=Pantoea sp. sgz302252 TaxID=3341827 RepID=UPI0036D3F2FE
MKSINILAALLLSLPLITQADSQCGPFHLAGQAADGGWASVNGVATTRRKISWSEQKGDPDNVKMHWTVAATKFQGNYGMDYVSQQGKATLDVEVMRSSRSQIKISGSYDCHKAG